MTAKGAWSVSLLYVYKKNKTASSLKPVFGIENNLA